MRTIDEYIEEAKKMKNVSAGGSPAYRFSDGVVLVAYFISKSIKELPRENEEKIAQIINEKRKKGVNTPYHLAIKRVETEKNLICFVLQEEAKGKIYSTYTDVEDNEKKLAIQEYFANISSDKLKKCITDLCELFNLGIELKPKNIFYDENEGFYFIDFLKADNTPFDYNSVADFIRIKKNANQIFNWLQIYAYSDADADAREVKKSKELYYKTIGRIFLTLEELPNFKKFRRTILRTYI